jgi:pimeloyl-ACP methyl ester carboxylesterase
VSSCPPGRAETHYVGVNGGPGLGHAGFEPLIRLQDSRSCVHLYDQRGTGKSLVPADDEYGLSAHVHDLRTVVGDAPSVIVVGASWGSLVATSFALQRPPSLRGLVLISPMPMTWPGLRRAEAQFRERIAWLTAVGTIDAGSPGRGACDELRRIYPAYFFDPENAPAFPGRVTCSDIAGAATLDAIRGYDILERASPLTIPVLLIRGAAEREIFGDEAKHDVMQLVDPAMLTYREVPACGHSMLAECPELVLAEVEDWLARWD